jgi:hypothetical protein
MKSLCRLHDHVLRLAMVVARKGKEGKAAEGDQWAPVPQEVGATESHLAVYDLPLGGVPETALAACGRRLAAQAPPRHDALLALVRKLRNDKVDAEAVTMTGRRHPRVKE